MIFHQVSSCIPLCLNKISKFISFFQASIHSLIPHFEISLTYILKILNFSECQIKTSLAFAPVLLSKAPYKLNNPTLMHNILC